MIRAGDSDDGARIVAAVEQAAAARKPLQVVGQGSKAERFAPPTAAARAERLSTLDHCGVLHYAPDELVLEARAGTPLAEIEALLARHHQVLPFEPPRLRGAGTLGGAVAAGLSGPARPWRGSVRDAVLGVELVNGLGERLRFGGRVVKNVAGYDVSRLQVGAFGAFGCLLSIAVRVLPAPTLTVTVHQSVACDTALAQLAHLPARALPLTGTAFVDGRLSLRLAGAPRAVLAAAAELGGERVEGDLLWPALRDQQHDFFRLGDVRWRASLPPGTGALPGDAQALIEWGGAQRWYRAADAGSDRLQGTDLDELQSAVRAAGGSLVPFAAAPWAQVSGARAVLQTRLRRAFDPHDLFGEGAS